MRAGRLTPVALFLALGVLRAQDPVVVVEGSERILHEGHPARRNPEASVFAQVPDLPAVPLGPRDHSEQGWDGELAWTADCPGHGAAWSIRRFRLSPRLGTTPPAWTPEPPVQLPKGLSPLLVLGDQALVLRHLPAEAGERDSTFEIGLFDLNTRTQEVIHTGPEPPAFLRIAAVNRDGDALLFLNTGQIALLKSGDHQLRILEDDAWGETQPEVLLSETIPSKGKVALPPIPLAPPFLGRDGRIGFLWQVRRRIHWSQAMMQAQYDALTPEWKEKVIQQGLWPPKTSSYEGSDTGIAGIWVDPDTGHCEAIPEEKLRALAEPERFTGILQPKAGSFGHLREAEDGRIVPVEMPRAEVEPLSGPSARPASPPDPRSPGGAAAPSRPRPAG